MNKVLLTTAIALALTLTACGEEKRTASFEEVETNRLIAKDNARQQAKTFRAEYGYGDLGLQIQGDSTISPSCPQGDGWASVKLISDDRSKSISFKCSTVSVGIGCLLSEEFKTKSYANQDGRCNSEVPHPLPKLVE